MKKHLSILFAVLLVALLMSVVCSADELGYGELEGIAIQDGHISASEDLISAPKFYSPSGGAARSNTKTLDDYKEEILDAWNTYSQDYINISDVGITTSEADLAEFQRFYSSLLDENPEYFYVNGSISYKYNTNTKIIIEIKPKYYFEATTIPSLKEKFDLSVEEALSCIDESMSDIDKMIALHDYIVLNAEYDLETYETHNNDHPTSFSAYGVLVENIGVCQSYTLAYSLLLEKVEIYVGTVRSKSLSHIWNLVKIGNDWYHVDVTWDDPTPDKKGLVSYKYFLASDAEFGSNDNQHKASDWVRDYFATSDTYKNAFWKESSSPLAYLDGYYYFADDFSAPANILRSKLSEPENFEQVRSLSGLSWKYQGGTVSGGQFRAVPFAFDGNLYYNTSDSIYRLCPEFNVDELVYQADIDDGFIVPIKINKAERSVSFLNVTYNGSKFTYSTPAVASLDGGHNYTESVTPPKDTEYGFTEKICSTCGDYHKYDVTNPLKYYPGDSDGDGEITAIDAIVMARFMAGWSNVADTALGFNLDLDGDEEMTSLDLIILKRHLAGWLGYETIPFNK